LCGCGRLSAGEDWPQYKFDAGHSAASPEVLPNQLFVRWVLDLPRPTPAWPDQSRMDFDASYHPLVVGNRVIVASPVDDSVAAYDLANGDLGWRFFTGGPVRLPPASDGTRVFAGSDDGWLYALKVDDGELIWKFKAAPKTRLVLGNGRLIDTWCVRGGPVVADGQVYFGAGIWPFMGVFLHCLDAATGQPVWGNSGEGGTYSLHPHSSWSFGSVAPQGSLTLSGEQVLVSGGRTLPACYDRRTGKPRYFMLNGKAGDYDVAASEEYFFCGGTAYELATGKAAGAVPESPVADRGDLYGVFGDAVVAADPAPKPDHRPQRVAGAADSIEPKPRETGPGDAVAGSLPATPTVLASPAEASPAVTASLPSVGSAASASRSVSKRRPRITAMARFPEAKVLIKAGPRLYAGGRNVVAALNLPLETDQPPAWQIDIEGTVSAMAAGRGHLVVTTEAGRIYCLGSRPGKTAAAAAAGVSPLTPAAVQRAENLVKDSGAVAGYALVLGAEGGELARALAAGTRLHVVILEPDATKAQLLRTSLQGMGLYGERIAVCVGDLMSLPLPPYWASLIVADEEAELPAGGAWCERLFRVLHPYYGKAYLKLGPEQRPALKRFAADDNLPGKAAVEERLGSVCLLRSGGLPGAGNWTHEHADAANTRVSTDKLVKAPLGLLWFGGSSHTEILPRHGHGPQPQVLDGRALVEKMDGLRALDIYTGHILWETSLPGLGGYYNNPRHQFGANGTGTNFISTPEAVYVRYHQECLRLDPATGTQLSSIALPEGAQTTLAGKDMIWGYLNVEGDYLIGGVATPDKQHLPFRLRPPTVLPSADPPENVWVPVPSGKEAPQALESHALFVIERGTGKLRWSAAAKDRFRHNATCAGGGRLYAIDRSPVVAGLPKWMLKPETPKPPTSEKGEVPTMPSLDTIERRDNRSGTGADDALLPALRNARKGKSPDTVTASTDEPSRTKTPESPPRARLLAFDLATGKVLWEREKGVFGTLLSYSARHDVLVESGFCSGDTLRDEARGMRAYRASDGSELWHDPKAAGPPMIHGDLVLRAQGACGVLDGKPLMVPDPLSGEPREWKWLRSHGCNTPAASEHLLVFRSGAAGYYDLARFGGTGNWGGFRSGCTNNLIVAGGLVTAPDYTRTCTCSFQNQTSLALYPDPDVEMWTYQGLPIQWQGPIRRLGVNFGAPGNRIDDDGTLWVEYPKAADAPSKAITRVAGSLAWTGAAPPAPSIQVTPVAAAESTFRLHSSLVTGPLPWVCASGLVGVESLSLPLGLPAGQPQRYTVRLYFAEPEDLRPGDRPFSVSMQGREIVAKLDVAKEAGGTRRGLVKTFNGILIEDELLLTLRPHGTRAAVLSGLELVAEPEGASR